MSRRRQATIVILGAALVLAVVVGARRATPSTRFAFLRARLVSSEQLAPPSASRPGRRSRIYEIAAPYSDVQAAVAKELGSERGWVQLRGAFFNGGTMVSLDWWSVYADAARHGSGIDTGTEARTRVWVIEDASWLDRLWEFGESIW